MTLEASTGLRRFQNLNSPIFMARSNGLELIPAGFPGLTSRVRCEFADFFWEEGPVWCGFRGEFSDSGLETGSSTDPKVPRETARAPKEMNLYKNRGLGLLKRVRFGLFSP